MKKAFKALISIVAAVMALCLVCSAAACGGGEDVVDTDSSITSIELSAGTKTLYTANDDGYDTSFTLTYTVYYADGTLGFDDPNASWRSSDSTVATVSGGTVTAVSAGTAYIRLSIGSKFAQCLVTVNDASSVEVKDTGITISPTSVTLTSEGATKNLVATVIPSNASDQSVTWRTEQTSVVSLTTNGNVCTVTALAGGTAYVYAYSATGFNAVCTVTVSGVEEAETQLYVAKVSSLSTRSTDFIMGMDASEVPSIEAARAATTYEANGSTQSKNAEIAYKDFDGNEADVFQVLYDNGITDIRVRIWNNPQTEGGKTYGGGECTVENATAIAKRCQAVGLGLIVDFHYSDFWADPGKQTVPKAWASDVDNASTMETNIYNFTKNSLTSILEGSKDETTGESVKIDMVQVGNETNTGMAGCSDMSTVAGYMAAGSKAVREVTGEVDNGGAKVAVHFTNAGSGGLAGYAKTLSEYNNSEGVDYDVFGVSWYPYYTSHGTLSNLTSQLNTIHNTYGKDVMVLETAYAYSDEDYDGFGNTSLEPTDADEDIPVTVQGQSNSVRNVINAIANLGDWGLGVCYWGGTWIGATSSADRDTNVNICKTYGCGWATADAYSYDSDANDGGSTVDNQTFFYADGTPIESLKVFKLVYEGQTPALTVDYCQSEDKDFEVNSASKVTLPTSVTVILNSGTKLTLDSSQFTWDSCTDEDLTNWATTVGNYDVTGYTYLGGVISCTIWVNYPNLLYEGSFENITGYADALQKIQSSTELGSWVLSAPNASSSTDGLYVTNASQNARKGTNSFHFSSPNALTFTLSQTFSAADFSTTGTYNGYFDIMGENQGSTTTIQLIITVTTNDGNDPKTYTSENVTLDGWKSWNRAEIDGVEIDLSTVTSVTYTISVSGTTPDTDAYIWGNIDNCQFYLAP